MRCDQSGDQFSTECEGDAFPPGIRHLVSVPTQSSAVRAITWGLVLHMLLDLRVVRRRIRRSRLKEKARAGVSEETKAWWQEFWYLPTRCPRAPYSTSTVAGLVLTPPKLKSELTPPR